MAKFATEERMLFFFVKNFQVPLIICIIYDYMCLNYLELLEVPKTIDFPIGKHPKFRPFPSPSTRGTAAPPPPRFGFVEQISVTALGPLHGMPELYILRQATQQGSPAVIDD